MPSWSADCGNEGQVKLVSEMCARKKPGASKSSVAESRVANQPMWSIASGAVHSVSIVRNCVLESVGIRVLASLLLARVVVCPVPQCIHFRRNRETTATQELRTLCVVRLKILSGGG